MAEAYRALDFLCQLGLKVEFLLLIIGAVPLAFNFGSQLIDFSFKDTLSALVSSTFFTDGKLDVHFLLAVAYGFWSLN